MKLLYCIPALYNAGGMERVLTEKVNFLSNLPNYEIIIVTTDQQGLPIRFELDKRIQIIHLDIDFNGHFAYNLIKKFILHKHKLKIYRTKLRSLIKDFNVDICISLCGKEIEFLDTLPVNCKKIAEIHFAMNNRKQFIISRHKGLLWPLLGEIRTHQLIHSVQGLDKLVVLTHEDKLQWESKHSNVVQIPNPNPLHNTHISMLNEKRVITLGKLDVQKGYDMLVDAWELVALKHPDWKLDIYGIGEWEQMLTNRIVELKLEKTLNLRGLTDDVASEYIKSSIYVMSSRYEGLPMVLIEAMSCGLPIISFDCEHGPREIIQDGINGYLVPVNNIKQLAEKIIFLIEHELIRKKMGKQATISALRFSKEPIMKRWIELFETTIK